MAEQMAKASQIVQEPTQISRQHRRSNSRNFQEHFRQELAVPLRWIGDVILKGTRDLLETALQRAIDVVEHVGDRRHVPKLRLGRSQRSDQLREFDVQSLNGGEILRDYRAQASQLGCVRFHEALFPSSRFRRGEWGWRFPIGPNQPAR